MPFDAMQSNAKSHDMQKKGLPPCKDDELAEILLNCLSNPLTIEQSLDRLHHICKTIFRTSLTINAAGKPTPANFEALLALCSVPSVKQRAAHCLLLLALSTPSAWRFFTATTVFTRPEISRAILNAFVGSSPFESVQTVDNMDPHMSFLLQTLRRLSDLDFWEQRAFLVMIPRTPFSYAVDAALLEFPYPSSSSEHQCEQTSSELSTKLSHCDSLQKLVLIGQGSEWEAVSDKSVLWLADLLYPQPNDKPPMSLVHRITAILPHSLYYDEACYLTRRFAKHLPDRVCPAEVDTLPDRTHFLHRVVTSPNPGADVNVIERSVLDLLCTISELANCLNHRPPTKVGRINLEKLASEQPNLVLRHVKALCAAAVTILTGLSNPASRYESAALSSLETLMSVIAVCVRKKCVADDVLVAKTFDFILGENRQINGVPALFAGVVNSLFEMVLSVGALKQRPDIINKISCMLKPRATCEEIRVIAQWTLQQMKSNKNG